MSELNRTKLQAFHESRGNIMALRNATFYRTIIDPVCGGNLKRGFDVAFALLAIILLSPLLIGLALAIKFYDGGPAFYGHTRVGRNGKLFKCWKFRSMHPNAAVMLQHYLLKNPDAAREWELQHKLKDDPRVTPLGRILRKYSVDELPQLFNILSGEMSFVGPRPVEKSELVNFGPSTRHYLRARPGLTGLWQISGRSDTTYQRRVALDRYYVAKCSLLLDVKVILQTVPVVLFGRGAY